MATNKAGLNKSDLRYLIASVVGAQIGSYNCKNSCMNLVRIETRTIEESLHLVRTLPFFIRYLKFFQAYDTDDFGTGGSIFYLGGGILLKTSAWFYFKNNYPLLNFI